MSIIVHFSKKLSPLDIYKSINIKYQEKISLAKNIWQSQTDIAPRALCAGLGKCAACKVKFLSSAPDPKAKELELLSLEQLSLGIRLACQHQSQDELELVIEQKASKLDIPTQSSTCQDLLLAIDIGTSSVCIRAVDRLSKEIILEHKSPNPQLSFGSDIISRLALASSKEGLAELNKIIVDYLIQIIQSFQAKRLEICIAANSIMTGIILNQDLSSLNQVPFQLDFTTGRKFSLNQEIQAYFPPLISAFVGGDLSADLACLMQKKESFILADLGTNAEFIYFDGLAYHATSVPLGPALEGMGLSCGAIYSEQIISNFQLSPLGIKGNVAQADGISASAYLQLIHILLNLGLIDSNGHFSEQSINPLANKLAKQIKIVNNEKRFILQDNLYLSASDIEEFLKVKAAFALAVEELLLLAKKNEITFILTGALGKHAPKDSLQALGFISNSFKQIQVIENAVLDGAILLLEDENLQEELTKLCQKVTVLELTSKEDFQEKYIAQMSFK